MRISRCCGRPCCCCSCGRRRWRPRSVKASDPNNMSRVDVWVAPKQTFAQILSVVVADDIRKRRIRIVNSESRIGIEIGGITESKLSAYCICLWQKHFYHRMWCKSCISWMSYQSNWYYIFYNCYYLHPNLSNRRNRTRDQKSLLSDCEHRRCLR